MVKSGFQQVNREWCDGELILRFMETAHIEHAQAAMNIALLCNVIMDNGIQDGSIERFDKTWIAEQCLWAGKPNDFFEALRDAGIVSYDKNNRPCRIEVVEALCGKRIADYERKAINQKEWRKRQKQKLPEDDTDEPPERQQPEYQTDRESQRQRHTSYSIERNSDVISTSELQPTVTQTAVNIVNQLYMSRVKMPVTEIQQYLDSGLEPIVILWAGDSASEANSPNSYFRTTLKNKLQTGITTYEKLRDTECQTDDEKSRFDKVWGKDRHAYDGDNV